MKKIFTLLLIPFLIASCKQDECEERIERSGTFIEIIDTVDEWMNEPEEPSEILFTNLIDSRKVTLSYEYLVTEDFLCNEISWEENRFIYILDGSYQIVASEKGAGFTVNTYFESDSSYQMQGMIQSNDLEFWDFNLIDSVEISGKQFLDVALLEGSEFDSFKLDDLYFQRGNGLVAFTLDEVTWTRE